MSHFFNRQIKQDSIWEKALINDFKIFPEFLNELKPYCKKLYVAVFMAHRSKIPYNSQAALNCLTGDFDLAKLAWETNTLSVKNLFLLLTISGNSETFYRFQKDFNLLINDYVEQLAQLAAACGHVKLLHDFWCANHLSAKQSMIPLYSRTAMEFNQFKVIQYFEEYLGSSFIENFRTFLKDLSPFADMNVVDHLIHHFFMRNAFVKENHAYYILHDALTNGHITLAKSLIENHGIDLLKSYGGCAAIIKTLSDRGAEKALRTLLSFYEFTPKKLAEFEAAFDEEVDNSFGYQLERACAQRLQFKIVLAEVREGTKEVKPAADEVIIIRRPSRRI